MLQIKNLEKTFGLHKIFDGVSLQMNAGERLGLVGRNGHGKTTLFKIILGQEEADAGEIIFPRNYRVGHLAQHLKFTKPTVLEEACLGLPPDEADAYYKAEAILFGLGFSEKDMTKAPHEFSGGFQIRMNLAKVLVSEPNLLLLDEPTNYLDIVSIRWLTRFLQDWPNEMIIISHDRHFMDDVTTHSACLHRCQLKKIKGNTHKLYEQILQEEEIQEKTRMNTMKKQKQMEVFINRFRAKASKASVVQSRIKMMNKLPTVNKLSEIETLDFKFHHESFPAKTVMEIENLSFGFQNTSQLISNLSLVINKEDRVAIIGKNGKGKSTLLNLIAEELQPLTGQIKKHPRTKIGYFGQTNINRLHEKNSIEEEVYSANTTLSRTTIKNICGIMMFDGDKSDKKIGVLSGGEKSRVMLGKILATATNLLLLDEPTNHLDMESIQSLVDSIHEYEGAVILVTHDEMILREVPNKLVVFHSHGVDVFNGTYDDFLEKIGWEDEGGATKSTTQKKAESNSAPAQTSKETHQKNVVANKDKKKIKQKMESLEKEIMSLEQLLANKTDALVSASEKNQLENIRTLSAEIKQCQQQIDETFEALAKFEKELI